MMRFDLCGFVIKSKSKTSLNHFSRNGCLSNHLLLSSMASLNSVFVSLPSVQALLLRRPSFFFSLMASKYTCLSFSFIFLFFCFVRMEILPPSPYCPGVESGCISAVASGLKETVNRKFLLSDFKRDAVVGENGGSLKMEGEDRRMMRRVPSGPDPLHHNGANPKKPRSP